MFVFCGPRGCAHESLLVVPYFSAALRQRARRRLPVLAAAVAVATLVASPASAATSTDTAWGQAAGNASHTGSASGEHTLSRSNAGHLKKVWHHSISLPTDYNGRISRPVAAYGFVYVVRGTQVIALHADKGNQAWQYTWPAGLGVGTPALGAGKIIVSTANGYVLALNAKTGKLLWKRAIGRSGTYDNSITYDGSRVFAIGGSDSVYALNVSTGSVAWRYRPAAGSHAFGVPTAAKGIVFSFVDSDTSGNPAWSSLVALNETSGKKLWQTAQLSSPSIASVNPIIYAAGKLVVTTIHSDLAAFDAATGTALWFTPGNNPANTPGGVPCLSAVGGSLIFAGGRDFNDTIGAYNLNTGAQTWAGTNLPCSWANVIGANGVVWYPTDDRALRALNPVNGHPYATVHLDGTPMGVAIVTGKLYLAVDIGNAYSIESYALKK